VAAIRGSTAVGMSKFGANSGTKRLRAGYCLSRGEKYGQWNLIVIPPRYHDDPTEIRGISHPDPLARWGSIPWTSWDYDGIGSAKSFRSWDGARNAVAGRSKRLVVAADRKFPQFAVIFPPSWSCPVFMRVSALEKNSLL